ncbi:TPA: hypothetical protein HA241_01690 [Candidatus Woesearchaeota archaeon]|nr:hypothetical protein [Candidatus Woesearchaeota archaeon]
MNKIFLFLGIGAGFAVAYFLSGKSEGQQGIVKSLLIPLGSYSIHLHHWLIALVMLIILFSLKIYNPFLHGFLLGLILQGLTYHDFYNIISKA